MLIHLSVKMLQRSSNFEFRVVNWNLPSFLEGSLQLMTVYWIPPTICASAKEVTKMKFIILKHLLKENIPVKFKLVACIRQQIQTSQ